MKEEKSTYNRPKVRMEEYITVIGYNKCITINSQLNHHQQNVYIDKINRHYNK